VWEITYDLTGSAFELADTLMGAGDQVNTVTEPYDSDDHVGPGTMVLRFQDVNGAPAGLVSLFSYEMTMNFVVGSFVSAVTTDLQNRAGPGECSVTTGTLTGDTVAWNPAALVGHRSLGSILCEGSMCGLANFEDGEPQAVDLTADQPLGEFVFTADLSEFTMAKTAIVEDENSTTTWTYEGTETDRQRIAAPACFCP
jgi:hypothetical protein